MEITAIILLIVVLIVGAIILSIFLQFLATVRDNHKLFQKIITEINALKSQVDGLAKVSEQKAESDNVD